MTMELSRPFEEYVIVHELGRTGDARRFEAIFPFLVEGTIRTDHRRIEWAYSGTQEAIDNKAGVDGAPGRRDRAIARLRRVVEEELKRDRLRLYDVTGEKLPVRGPQR